MPFCNCHCSCTQLAKLGLNKHTAVPTTRAKKLQEVIQSILFLISPECLSACSLVLCLEQHEYCHLLSHKNCLKICPILCVFCILCMVSTVCLSFLHPTIPCSDCNCQKAHYRGDSIHSCILWILAAGVYQWFTAPTVKHVTSMVTRTVSFDTLLISYKSAVLRKIIYNLLALPQNI